MGVASKMPASVRCSCGRPGTPREVQKPWGKGSEALVRHEAGACETGGGGHTGQSPNTTRGHTGATIISPQPQTRVLTKAKPWGVK